MTAEWERLEEGIVQSLAQEAVTLLKPHLGADLLSPLPEVVSHSDPLSPDTPLTLTLRLTLQPAPPDPLQSDRIWPPDPAQEAMRHATAANKEAPMQQTPSPLQPHAASPAPAYPGVPPPPPGVPAAGAGHSPLPTHVPAPTTSPLPQSHQPQDHSPKRRGAGLPPHSLVARGVPFFSTGTMGAKGMRHNHSSQPHSTDPGGF